MNVKFVSVTKSDLKNDKGENFSAEDLIVYCARVSNPSNQSNMDTAPKLLKYLIDNKHWSPFEMVDMTVEIKTSRAIAQQILRHRSFSFQEFSQRYSKVTEFEPIQLRLQAQKNRQSSTDVVEDETLYKMIDDHLKMSQDIYNHLLDKGVSKETARFILPLTTQTTMYMKGSVRSWLTFLNLRLHHHAQKEVMGVAQQIRDIFCGQFPNITQAIGNFDTAYQQHFI